MLNIKTDSRLVCKGDTFVAIKGHTVDGHDYIETAIKNGATKIIAEHGKFEVDTIIVEDTEYFIAALIRKDEQLHDSVVSEFSNLIKPLESEDKSDL